MISIVVAVVLIAGWLAFMVAAFALHKRWRIMALPLPKRALVYAGFAITALVVVLIGFAVWLLVSIQFCTPPGCF